ncbi:hypothetical protein NQZ68_013711 [Dissostichus eleginoides]|nr:hypothetical protein NQZ68_013711 [Dissostichus eleginoides]
MRNKSRHVVRAPHCHPISGMMCSMNPQTVEGLHSFYRPAAASCSCLGMQLVIDPAELASPGVGGAPCLLTRPSLSRLQSKQNPLCPRLFFWHQLFMHDSSS